MSPEIKGYMPQAEKVVVKIAPGYGKTGEYAKAKNWGVTTNKRLSTTGYWRK